MPTSAQREENQVLSALVSYLGVRSEFRGDPSNRLSGKEPAIALGELLFFSKELSGERDMSCATCHDPAQAFTDGKARGVGQTQLVRNTPSLLNIAQNRWFGWAGQNDNLWAQSIEAIVAPDEMALALESLSERIAMNADLAEGYTATFGKAVNPNRTALLAEIGKALAAYQETLTTPPSLFDLYRDGKNPSYPEAAKRGALLFVGEAGCASCHFGPNFTSGEFNDVGIPYFTDPPETKGLRRIDKGRFEGVELVKSSPFNLDGAHSDDSEKSGAWKVRTVRQRHDNFGAFRVPALRNVVSTPPYMHNGSLGTLEDVVRHYNEPDMERLHADGEALIRPLGLSDQDLSDLVEFLKTL